MSRDSVVRIGLFQSSVSWRWPKDTWALGTRLVICRSCGELSANGREEKLHRMIIWFIRRHITQNFNLLCQFPYLFSTNTGARNVLAGERSTCSCSAVARSPCCSVRIYREGNKEMFPCNFRVFSEIGSLHKLITQYGNLSWFIFQLQDFLRKQASV